MSDSDDKSAPGGSERALQEFLSEAQELVDALNSCLLTMDQQRSERGDDFDPDLVNEAFRGVHSIKGLAGLFGFGQISELSHTLETLLDSMRLGKVPANPAILDLLFESVELFGILIGAAAAGHEIDEARIHDYFRRLDAATRADEGAAQEVDELSQYQLSDTILSVLTEYEEHRLRENIKASKTIYTLHAAFDLMSIDAGLEQLKDRIKPVGEVITYLPAANSIDDTTIELDVLVGAGISIAELRGVVADSTIEVSVVPRADAEIDDDPDPGPGPAPDPGPDRPDDAGSPPAAAAVAPPDSGGKPRAVAPSSEEPLSTIRSVSQTVRVDIRKLDSLMNVVGELILVHGGISDVVERMAERAELAEEVRALQRELRSLERRHGELQSGILEVRMVPLRQVFDKLSRVVRKISRESGKEIRLDVSGADTELDKLIVEELSDPLMHIIRNAIDHGVEEPEVRRQAGKSEVATIRIDAKQQGNRVVVTVADDGRGIDEERVAQVAVERGVVDDAAVREMSRRELLNLLFLPGMSTRAEATELSGRGVGLDVVKTNIANLSGMIDINSSPQRGTEFALTLPITLAIIQALVIKTAGQIFAVPLNSVLESLVIDVAEVKTVEGREVYSLRSQTLVLARLDKIFRLPLAEEVGAPEKLYVVVIGMAQHRLGLIVDELHGERDIVIKSLGRVLSGVRGIAGATELGHQRAVLVLDVPSLVDEALLRGAGEEAA